MHPSYVHVDPDLLRRLYADERLTTDAIAAQLGCGGITVLRRLRKFRIPVRPRGPSPGHSLHRAGVVPQFHTIWSPDIAYVVGLIATDGNLSKNGRTVSVSSKDTDLLETVRRCLHLTNRITPYKGGYGSCCYRVQWGGRQFYNWLMGLGFTPAKSLTLGPLAVPDEYFADFFRGCVDGDGCVLVYIDRYHTAKRMQYVYERLYVSLVSAGRPFLEWMQTTICRLVSVSGAIHDSSGRRQRPLWVLRYAKAESIRLIGWMYYAPDVPCLARKRAKAERFLSPLGYISVRSVGRPRVGWLYNAEAKAAETAGDGPGWCNAATHDSKSCARKGVRVRIPPPAPFLDNIPRRPVT